MTRRVYIALALLAGLVGASETGAAPVAQPGVGTGIFSGGQPLVAIVDDDDDDDDDDAPSSRLTPEEVGALVREGLRRGGMDPSAVPPSIPYGGYNQPSSRSGNVVMPKPKCFRRNPDGSQNCLIE